MFHNVEIPIHESNKFEIPTSNIPALCFSGFHWFIFVKSLVYLEIENADCTENALPTVFIFTLVLRNNFGDNVASVKMYSTE